jgi:hypothetical protein
VTARTVRQEERAKRKVREYRLFAKEKSKAVKDRMVGQMTTVVEKTRRRLGETLQAVAGNAKTRLRGYKKVALAKVTRIRGTMEKLVPQIRYWPKTGFVAANKIVSLHIPELCAIVRGKVGKTVEFVGDR